MQQTNYTVVGNTLHFSTQTVPADPDYYALIKKEEEEEELMQLKLLQVVSLSRNVKEEEVEQELTQVGVRRDVATGPEVDDEDEDKPLSLTHTLPSDGSHVGHTQSESGPAEKRRRRGDATPPPRHWTEPVVPDDDEGRQSTLASPRDGSHDVGHTQTRRSRPEKAHNGNDARDARRKARKGKPVKRPARCPTPTHCPSRVRRKARKGTPVKRPPNRSGSVESESGDTGDTTTTDFFGASSDFVERPASPVYYTLDEMMHFSQLSVRGDDDTGSELEEDTQQQHPPAHPQTLLSDGHTQSGPAAENDAERVRRGDRKRKSLLSLEYSASESGDSSDASDASDEWDFHSSWEPSPRRRSPSPFSSDEDEDETDAVEEEARPTTPPASPFVGPENDTQLREEQPTQSREEQPTQSREEQPTQSGEEQPTQSREEQPTQSREEQPTSSTLPPDGRKGVRPPAADRPKWYEMNWQPKDIPFTADPGPRNGAADLQSDQPVDFLELFITDELLQNIVVQTNLYAEQFIHSIVEQGTLGPFSRARAWKPVTVIELKNFLGLFFLTGVIRKPEIGMFWSTDEPLATPFFNKTMSRNRFQLIWRFLHFNDNESISATDRLYKVRPVMDYLLSKFGEMFQPDKNISIDEGMLLWRGRLAFRVYNPQKPIKYGIKSYILCDSGTGYCFNMKPYCGQHATLGDTVVFLLDKLAGHGYRLYMDNFYNSVPMCTLLIGLKTHVVGTLRKNRGEPPAIREVTTSDLEIGERIMRHNDTVMVLAWRDRQIVRMVTTLHKNEMEEVVPVGRKGHKNRVPRQKPTCIIAYNKSMNGVDRLDQNIAYYPCVRKSAKWTKKFVTYLFQICLFNAFVIYKAKNPKGSCKFFSLFIQSVVKSWTSLRPARAEEVSEVSEVSGERELLLQVNANPLIYGHRAPAKDPKSRLNANVAAHVLVKLPPSAKKKYTSRGCRVCIRKGMRRETRLYCKSCRVPLHAGECYTLYHSKVKYAA